MNRNYLYNYLKENKNKYIIDYPFINRNNNIITLDEYLQSMNTNSYYSGELEMKLTSDIFKINILVLQYNDRYKGYIRNSKLEIKKTTYINL